MDFNAIDWSAMWMEESAASHWGKNRLSNQDVWNHRADSFSQRINGVVKGKDNLDKDDYISQMLERIEVQPDWSVLDIGCGPGTMTIPLARKARSVTALDISSEMLKHLKANAEETGLNNIHYINASWQEANANRQVAKHDVVVASRSLMSGNMKEDLAQIIAATEHAAYLTLPVIHLPFDWEVYKLIGRAGKKHPPYIYALNMLFQMGIQANVEILRSRVKSRFSSIEQTIDNLQWRTEPFSPEERAKLTAFLEKKFGERKDSQVFTHEGYSKWALIWWRKEEQQ
jgi:FkbM family methyltransferase